MSPADVRALYRQIEAMTPSDQLRLAAGLIERDRLEVAEVLVKRIADELAAVRLLGRTVKETSK